MINEQNDKFRFSGNNQFWMYRKDRRIMGLLYVFDVDGLSPGSNVILVWIDHKSDRQFFDYNTKVFINSKSLYIKSFVFKLLSKTY